MLTCAVNWTYNAAITTQTLPRSPSRSPNPNFTRAQKPPKFLIANPRLEIAPSTTKQTTSHFLIANRLQFFNFASVNPVVSSRVSPYRNLFSASFSFRATYRLSTHPSRATNHESRFTNYKAPLSSHNFLTATVARFEFCSTCCKQAIYRFSNRNKNASYHSLASQNHGSRASNHGSRTTHHHSQVSSHAPFRSTIPASRHAHR